MTPILPELQKLPDGLVLDGELVAWMGKEPWFPNEPWLDGPGWATSETFEDGHALVQSVWELGLEGVVAKKRSGRYRPGERGWIKAKNPSYWRRESEIEGVRRSVERGLARI